MTPKYPIPTEAQEQKSLFSWAEMQSYTYPELRLMYHIPNGGSRHKLEAANLRAEGVKAGVPDICLPVARGEYHGLYIEMKRISGGTVSAFQKQWQTELNAQGYKAVICKGWKEAKEVILEYLKTKG